LIVIVFEGASSAFAFSAASADATTATGAADAAATGAAETGAEDKTCVICSSFVLQ
jgi:hypothetical protein